jgi:DNA-binding MarR family transcriptional regulator
LAAVGSGAALEGVLFLLTSLVLWGDIANNLLSEARDKAGLNATQAQICLLLSGFQDGVRAAPKALTPAEISRALCSPGTRIHNQLAILVARKWLKRGADGTRVDGRDRPYVLTHLGLQRASIYWKQMLEAEFAFERVITKKDVEALERLDARLTEAIEVGALNGKVELEVACAGQLVSLPRRWHQ